MPSDEDYGPDVDSRAATAGELFARKRQKVRYHYDFGDDWVHEVVLEDVLKAKPGVEYPVCVAGERACPPEDCGGPYGYAELLHAVRGPQNERQRELLEWIGGSFDAEQFELAEANERLRKLPELLEAAERDDRA